MNPIYSLLNATNRLKTDSEKLLELGANGHLNIYCFFGSKNFQFAEEFESSREIDMDMNEREVGLWSSMEGGFYGLLFTDTIKALKKSREKKEELFSVSNVRPNLNESGNEISQNKAVKNRKFNIRRTTTDHLEHLKKQVPATVCEGDLFLDANDVDKLHRDPIEFTRLICIAKEESRKEIIFYSNKAYIVIARLAELVSNICGRPLSNNNIELSSFIAREFRSRKLDFPVTDGNEILYYLGKSDKAPETPKEKLNDSKLQSSVYPIIRAMAKGAEHILIEKEVMDIYRSKDNSELSTLILSALKHYGLDDPTAGRGIAFYLRISRLP